MDTEFGLGRRPEFDERSRDFPIMALLGADQRTPRSYTWGCPVNLDQGREGACVGFAWAQELAARPVAVKGIVDQTGRSFYQRAQQLDDWPGEEPAYSGTSVIAGAKAVMEAGHLKEYRWAFGVDQLAVAVSRQGPAVIGIDWHQAMYQPDANGFIHPTGPVVGGHAILVRGYSVPKRRFVLRNSWGAQWGMGGDCFITHDELGALLANRGDCCVPVMRG
jgi:hypothetical protein